MLSDEALDFLKRNGTSYEELKEKVGTRLYSLKNIDYIVNSYLIRLGREPKQVSIADVVGYDYEFGNKVKTNDIFKSFPNFFETNGDSYHTRAISMLEYTGDNVVQGLLRSFSVEPIKIGAIPKGKYIIEGNGLHRYTVLRSLYLIELSKLGNDNDAIMALNNKYMIQVEAAEIDYIKTYSHYVLNTLGIVNYIGKEFDGSLNPTGNAIVEFRDRQRKIMGNSELIQLVTTSLMENKQQWIFFMSYLNNSEEFRAFIEIVCPEMLIPEQKEVGGNLWTI